jgi:hypothetical protein
MECWAARLGDREAVAEFLVTELGFHGCFGTELGVELSFCLPSISPFHSLLFHFNLIYTIKLRRVRFKSILNVFIS